MGKCYILLLNYNGWNDTIECLESTIKSDYKNFQIIVVDNNSPNNSMEYIVNWTEGRQKISYDEKNQLNILSQPGQAKPIDYVLYDKTSALAGGCAEIETKGYNPLILIQAGENKGFSAGNNIGIQYALAKGDAEYIWVLNNDTVIEVHTLSELVEKASSYRESNEKVGIIGSKLMYYHTPNVIQSIGGIYNSWLATSTSIGQMQKDNGEFDTEAITEQIDYPIGASMFVSVDFIRDVGLMCEDYFLYYEELDWTLRGKAKGWKIGYCWRAKVFHKEGGSIGSSAIGTQRSKLSDFYGLKNRIVFSKKFYPKKLWSVRLGFLVSLFNRLTRGQLDRVNLIFRALLEKPFH
ncbi:Glycosyl transferase family 2 [compost metagenome]